MVPEEPGREDAEREEVASVARRAEEFGQGFIVVLYTRCVMSVGSCGERGRTILSDDVPCGRVERDARDGE
jgi:hypothetical protein